MWITGWESRYLSRNIGEVTPEKPKHRFPNGFSKHVELFGCYELKEDHKLPLRIVYVVESPLAVMAFHQKGFPAVSPFGAYVTVGQLKILQELAKGIVFLPDRDKFGQLAEDIQMLSAFVWTKCPELPDSVNDPEYLTSEQIKSLT